MIYSGAAGLDPLLTGRVDKDGHQLMASEVDHVEAIFNRPYMQIYVLLRHEKMSINYTRMTK